MENKKIYKCTFDEWKALFVYFMLNAPVSLPKTKGLFPYMPKSKRILLAVLAFIFMMGQIIGAVG